jgi:cell volume regulation protein A
MNSAHELILLGGVLGLVSILGGAFAARFKAPLLLVFLLLGMLAGENGPGGIVFNNFEASYLLGSLALAVILFEGGLKTGRGMVTIALWPSMLLATLGVLITAGFIAAVAVWLFHLSWLQALLIGAAVAPTDAAAVATLLRQSGVKLPPRLGAILELESGLNDPISVFLMVFAVTLLTHPGSMTLAHGVILVLREMLGGIAFGLAGGFGLVWLLRTLRAEPGIFPVLAFAGALSIFGAAQCVEASGFLAVYIAGFIVNDRQHKHAGMVGAFFDAFAWVAQIGLFVLLGLLVTPAHFGAIWKPAVVTSFALMLLARPLAGFVCLAPFGVKWREIGFISWVGLRGAVPIYLTIIPVLAGLPGGQLLFSLVFVVVVMSLVIQGWTVGVAAKLLGFGKT